MRGWVIRNVSDLARGFHVCCRRCGVRWPAGVSRARHAASTEPCLFARAGACLDESGVQWQVEVALLNGFVLL